MSIVSYQLVHLSYQVNNQHRESEGLPRKQDGFTSRSPNQKLDFEGIKWKSTVLLVFFHTLPQTLFNLHLLSFETQFRQEKKSPHLLYKAETVFKNLSVCSVVQNLSLTLIKRQVHLINSICLLEASIFGRLKKESGKLEASMLGVFHVVQP